MLAHAEADQAEAPESEEGMRIIEVSETQPFVFETAKEVKKLIYERVADIHPKQKWVLIGRIVSLVFSDHFQMALFSTNEDVRKTEIEFMKECDAKRKENAKS